MCECLDEVVHDIVEEMRGVRAAHATSHQGSDTVCSRGSTNTEPEAVATGS
ncbi:MAG TPA: hypothetical protein VGO68_21910 [Pyrinomonadaceae bacterium]|jgi:hypothetical protein|nr:hypothetical protein [Pyrinomonadaceae bacterium]